jgi:hypothetical protein
MPIGFSYDLIFPNIAVATVIKTWNETLKPYPVNVDHGRTVPIGLATAIFMATTIKESLGLSVFSSRKIAYFGFSMGKF